MQWIVCSSVFKLVQCCRDFITIQYNYILNYRIKTDVKFLRVAFVNNNILKSIDFFSFSPHSFFVYCDRSMLIKKYTENIVKIQKSRISTAKQINGWHRSLNLFTVYIEATIFLSIYFKKLIDKAALSPDTLTAKQFIFWLSVKRIKFIFPETINQLCVPILMR